MTAGDGVYLEETASASPPPPPRPDINDFILASLVPTVDNQIPVEAGPTDATVVGPHTDSLTVLKGNLLLLLALPDQDAVLLANAANLPTVVYPRKVWAGHWIVQAPGHQETPAGIVIAWHLALVGDRLAAEG